MCFVADLGVSVPKQVRGGVYKKNWLYIFKYMGWSECVKCGWLGCFGAETG